MSFKIKILGLFSIICLVIAGVAVNQSKVLGISAVNPVIPTLKLPVSQSPEISQEIQQEVQQEVQPTPTQTIIIQPTQVIYIYPTYTPYPTLAPYVTSTPVQFDCTIDGKVVGQLTYAECSQKITEYYAQKVAPTPAGTQYTQNSTQIDCLNKYRALGALNSSQAMHECYGIN